MEKMRESFPPRRREKEKVKRREKEKVKSVSLSPRKYPCSAFYMQGEQVT
jgi:hypothetical protein